MSVSVLLNRGGGAVAADPKPFLGYSDNTNLLNWLWTHGVAGFYALEAGRIITYCGGGIAASSDAFALALLGRDDVAVYDASLSEWARDPTLPMQTG